MPLIVDKEQVRGQILEAFEACLRDRPMNEVTLRDIAAVAGMSHPKLLNYFGSKDEIVLAYCRYVQGYMTDHCKAWFMAHDRADYVSDLDYLDDFMRYVMVGGPKEHRPDATVQTYVLAHYDTRVHEVVSAEFVGWRKTMERCLRDSLGEGVGAKDAEAMMVLVVGAFVCHHNGALTGAIDGELLRRLAGLAGALTPIQDPTAP